METPQRHAGDSGRQGDKGAHHRQQTRQENRDRSVFEKELRGAVQIVPAEQNVLAKTLHQRAAPVGSDPISHCRAQVAAEGAGRGHPQKLEPARVDQVPGERHDDFRRQRNAGRLDAHQQRDAQVTRGGNNTDDEVGEDS